MLSSSSCLCFCSCRATSISSSVRDSRVRDADIDAYSMQMQMRVRSWSALRLHQLPHPCGRHEHPSTLFLWSFSVKHADVILWVAVDSRQFAMLIPPPVIFHFPRHPRLPSTYASLLCCLFRSCAVVDVCLSVCLPSLTQVCAHTHTHTRNHPCSLARIMVHWTTASLHAGSRVHSMKPHGLHITPARPPSGGHSCSPLDPSWDLLVPASLGPLLDPC